MVGTVIRKNVRCMAIWRLRNQRETETICEELSGIYSKEEILELYKHATAEAFSFLFVRLDAKTRDNMFWLRFEKRLVPKETDDGDDGTGSVGSSPGGLQQVREDKPQPGPKAQRPKPTASQG
jgi:hypothetical protein